MQDKQCRECGIIKTGDLFHVNKNYKDGLHCDCKACRKIQSAQRYQLEKAKINARNRAWRIANKQQSAEIQRRRYYKNQLKIFQIVGSQCAICKYDKCLTALDFHHTDPSIKDSAVSNLFKYKFETVLAEAKKCVVLCCRCHRELHAGLVKLP